MGLESATYIQELVNSNPLGTDPRSQGDDHIRLLKEVLKATFPNANRPYYFPSSTTPKTSNYTVKFPEDGGKVIPVNASGGNRTVTLPAMAGDGTDGFNVTVVKTDSSSNRVTISGVGSGKIDGSDTAVIEKQNHSMQVEWVGAISAWAGTRKTKDEEFPAGTRLLFQQTTPPSGWVKDTSHNNKALRVVSGSAGSGGALSFTSCFASNITLSGTVQPHTLTTAQIPSHSHGLRYYSGVGFSQGGMTAVNYSGSGGSAGTTDSAGGGGSHSHSLSMNRLDMEVAYVDVVIAVKQ